MKKTLELWFPNYKNNPGIVSKELLQTIRQQVQHFDVTVEKGYFDGYETFIVDLDFENEGYIAYVTDLIYQTLGGFPDPGNLKEGDLLLGRVFSPGKVGFGLFTDIGLRGMNQQIDALLPLYQMRDDLDLEEKSTREIVKLLGLISGFPIPVEIKSVHYDPKLKIDVKFASIFIDRYRAWSDEERQRLLFTKTLQSSITSLVKKLQLEPYIEEINALDPLTTVLTCDYNTNASGLIPKLGSRLKNVPIGIFHPQIS